jgi:endonuclease/exonuclease/phosphatase family metal-dependent hydrolase
LLAHLNEVAKQIRDSRADVVVLNEVDFDANWSFGVNQATWLAEKAGYGYVVEQANMDVWVPFGRWRFGNAVLSRIPVVRWESVRFPPRSRWEAWLVGNHDGLLVELQNEEVGLNVFAVHLDFRDEATRVRAAERIAEVAGRSFWPFVAAGDFNSSPKGHRAAELDAGGANAVTFLIEQQGFVPASPLAEDAALYTFPSARLTRTIDWILAQDAGQLDFGGTIPSALSDHLMIWADVAPPAAESR